MLKATLEKELQLLRRDPRVIVRLLVLPLVFIAIFGMVFKSDAARGKQRRTIALWVDPAAARFTAPIRAALEGSGMFAVDTSFASEAAIRARISDGSLDVGIALGADFDPAHGHPGRLLMDTSGPPQVVGPMIGSVSAIVGRAYEGLGAPPVVLVPTQGDDKKATIEDATPFQITVPGNAVLFGFFIALTCALSFAEERRSGTWRRLLAAPVPRWKLLVAKLIPYAALGALQVGLLFAIGVVGFGMQIGGSLPALIVLTIGVACSATTLGLLIAAVSTTEKQISSLGSVAIMVMGLLGGCMVPRLLMPHALQQVGLAVPHGWALDGYATLLVHRGAGFADVAPQIAAVYGFAVLFGVAGVRRFRFDR
jgi:linearmycin/streptolysin S transport system permease protein